MSIKRNNYKKEPNARNLDLFHSDFIIGVYR